MNRNISGRAFFNQHVLPLIAGFLLVLATLAFVGIPWSMGAHPGEVLAQAPVTSYHPS